MKKQKLWRKCCFLFTALALFIFAPKALAYAEETNRTVIPEGFVLYAESWEANPLGAKAGEELTGSTKPILVEPTSEETLAGDGEVCSTLADAADCLREAMTKRESSVLITMYFDTEKEIHEAPETIRTLAKEHTGIPTEGDYLLWQYRKIHTGWSYGHGYIASLGKYSWHATYTFTITYYTNAAQEKEVDDAVTAFLADNIRAGMTDYEKVKAIHDFICKTVTYDHKNLEDESYMLKYTAYAALINHTAVCQGYALLFYRLCLEANVDARYLSGIGYSTLGSGDHGWNLVKLGSHYYNIDCTWDENISDKRNPENIILSYKYFLRTDGNFADHVRDDEYKTAEFYTAYPMGASDYDPDAAPAEPTFDTHSLSLDGLIGVNFYVDPGDADLAGAKMLFTLKSQTSTVSADDASHDDKGRYKFTCYVNSISMADKIHAALTLADGTAIEDNYSVLDYLNVIAANENNAFSDSLVTLAKAINNYGYYAQQMHGFDGGVAMTLVYTDVAPVSSLSGNELSAVKASDVQKVTANLTLNASTFINLFFTTASEAFDASVENLGTCSSSVRRLSDGRVRVQITGIPAHRLVDSFEVTAVTDSGQETKVKVSALSYAQAVLASDDFGDDVKNCVGALVTYYRKTLDYANSKAENS